MKMMSHRVVKGSNVLSSDFENLMFVPYRSIYRPRMCASFLIFLGGAIVVA